MKTIGFTEVFYTLWEVGEPYESPTYYNGIKVSSVMKQDVIYCQNLSKDFEKAKSHAKLVDQKYEIDLDLRGHSSFTRTIEGSATFINWETYFPQDCFSFGKMQGVIMKDCTDVWQLKRAYCEEKSARRRVTARRRLIELGELVRIDWMEKRWFFDNIGDERDDRGSWREVRRKYATLEQLADIKEREKSGHFFSNSQKVTLELKEIKKFGFEGMYGFTSVRVYETKCGKIVKYVGGSPLKLVSSEELRLKKVRSELLDKCNNEVDKDVIVDIEAKLDGIEASIESIVQPEWFKVSATIKHDNYKGPETKLLRMKIVK